jgi:hypothetical protein
MTVMVCFCWLGYLRGTKRDRRPREVHLFFKAGVLTRVMSGRDTASLETGAGAKAANSNVDDLSEVIRALGKKAQGEYFLRGTVEYIHYLGAYLEFGPTVGYRNRGRVPCPPSFAQGRNIPLRCDVPSEPARPVP